MRHWSLKNPVISDWRLAEYMVADNATRFEIIRNCKFPPIAQTTHIKEAQFNIGAFLQGRINRNELENLASDLNNRICSSAFDFELTRLNADCINRFLSLIDRNKLPRRSSVTCVDSEPIYVAGVKISPDIPVRFQVKLKSCASETGGIAFHFTPGKPVISKIANWQAAFVYGYIRQTRQEDWIEVDRDQCLVVDIATGRITSALSNAESRFNKLKKACTEIAERWQQLDANATSPSLLPDQHDPNADFDRLSNQLSASVASALSA